ncbi:hypothetical protein QL285_070359 [Trifolium repens]|nr:hypothetical protein QL285_070359 [Trifolium repens]
MNMSSNVPFGALILTLCSAGSFRLGRNIYKVEALAVQERSVDLAKYSREALLFRLRWIQRLNQRIKENSNSKYVSRHASSL